MSRWRKTLSRRGLIGGVPERSAVVIEGGKQVLNLRAASAHVAERERRPVREIALRGGAVTREVSQRQLGERLGAVQTPGRGHPIGEGRVRVHPVNPPTAAYEPVQLEQGEQEHQQLPDRLDTVRTEAVGKLFAGLVGLLRKGVDNGRCRTAETGAGQPMDVL